MAASSTPPITLLIVDDNSGIRTLLTALARRDSGLEVVGEAANGMEAIEVAGEREPDVVILDIMMPEMDGIEAIPGILEASPDSCIVMYSAYAESHEAAMERGAHGWCLKGEPWEAMAREIRRVVSERDAVA